MAGNWVVRDDGSVAQEGSIDRILSEFLQKLDDRIIELERCAHKKYKEGFKDGYDFARQDEYEY